MNKLLFPFLFIAFLYGCNPYNPTTFKVNGKIINSDKALVQLITFSTDSSIVIVDSITVFKNQKFTLKTHASDNTLYALSINNLPYYYITNDVKEIEISIDSKFYDGYKVNMSPQSQAIKDYFVQYDVFAKKISKAKDTLQKAKQYKFKDSLINILQLQEQTAINTLKTYCASSANKAECAALKYLTIYYGFKSGNLTTQQTTTLIDDAVVEYPNQTQLIAFKNQFDAFQSSNPELVLQNKDLPNFVLPLVGGDSIKSLSLKGKYVLLDFWDTNSNTKRQVSQLTKTYKQYKDTNFTILSICLDAKTIASLQSIKKDSLVWQNHLDTLALKSELAKKFYIKQLPFNVLVSSTNKIISVNVFGKDLTEKLKSLYQR